MATYTITNPWALLMLRITDRLKAQVPTLKLIVKDIAQLETPEQPSIDGMGTVLIGFADFTLNELGNNVQEGEGDIIIKIVKDAYGMVSSITPDTVNEEVLKYTILEQQVYEALHGWAPGEPFGNMSRRSKTEDMRRPGLMVAIHRYRIALNDYSAQPTQQMTPTDYSITVEIND